MANKLVHIFFDVFLGNGHSGLCKIAARNKIDLNTLGSGQCVAFINRRQNAVKMFAGGSELLLHYKTTHGGAMDAEALQLLPEYIEGGQLNYSAAITEVIKRKIKNWNGDR